MKTRKMTIASVENAIPTPGPTSAGTSCVGTAALDAIDTPSAAGIKQITTVTVAACQIPDQKAEAVTISGQDKPDRSVAAASSVFVGPARCVIQVKVVIALTFFYI